MVNMDAIQHENIIALERELLWHDGKWAHILVILTDLPVDAYDTNFNADDVNQLIRYVAGAMNESGEGYHSIVVRHKKKEVSEGKITDNHANKMQKTG